MNNPKQLEKFEAPFQPAAPMVARKLAQGLTLIPYWGRNEWGKRVALCCWGTLLPGETLSDAAHRLTHKREE